MDAGDHSQFRPGIAAMRNWPTEPDICQRFVVAGVNARIGRKILAHGMSSGIPTDMGQRIFNQVGLP